jgi:hypothetical protein
MADQPLAPKESFAFAGVSRTDLDGDNVKYDGAILTAPRVPTPGGGGGGGTTAHGFVS